MKLFNSENFTLQYIIIKDCILKNKRPTNLDKLYFIIYVINMSNELAQIITHNIQP